MTTPSTPSGVLMATSSPSSLATTQAHEERSLNYNDPIIYPAEPVKEGHTFNGWSETIDSMPAHDLIITSQWIVNNYTVIFDLNNGSEAKEVAVEFEKEVPVLRPCLLRTWL